MDERLENKATYIGNPYPENAVCYVELRHRPPRKWGIYEQPEHSLMMTVRSRYSLNTYSIARYEAISPMTEDEAYEWAAAKAKQLEE